MIVEVADTSLPQDRLTKTAIYAAAGIPEYWIVDIRGQRIVVYRDPIPHERRYLARTFAHRTDEIERTALQNARVAVDDLLPVIDV